MRQSEALFEMYRKLVCLKRVSGGNSQSMTDVGLVLQDSKYTTTTHDF